jgi:hypothetical protein
VSLGPERKDDLKQPKGIVADVLPELKEYKGKENEIRFYKVY